MKFWDAILLGVGFAGALAFVVLYFTRSPGWWRSSIGQNLMAKAGVLALLFGLSFISMFFILPQWVGWAVVSGLDVVLWWRVIILWMVQQEARKERTNGPGKSS